jgi:hypothetical protein
MHNRSEIGISQRGSVQSPDADDRRGLAGLGRPADNPVLGIGPDASRRVDVIEAPEERFVMTGPRSTETAPAPSKLRVPVGVIIAIACVGLTDSHLSHRKAIPK